MRLLAFAATFSILALPAFAQKADIAPGYKPAINSDEAGLWMMVEQAERGTQQSPLLVKDSDLNAYIRRIVCKLAVEQCGSLRVYLVDVPEFNASCYPNGMVHVWTGFLLRAENEAQLAFVLGHEITHYLKRHSLNNYQSRRDTYNALSFLALGAAGASVGVGVDLRGAMDMARLIAIGALQSYSRDQEREADAGGFDLTATAGYDLTQGAAIWKSVEEEQDSNPRRRTPLAFLASHPSNKERLQTMERMAKERSAVLAKPDGNEEFDRVLGPYRAVWLEEELNRGALTESITLLQRLSHAHPDIGLYTYYLGEAYRRRNEVGDMDKALGAYRTSAARDGAPAAVFRGLGMTALKTGHNSEAKAAFQQYLNRSPTAADRSMVELYIARTEAQ